VVKQVIQACGGGDRGGKVKSRLRRVDAFHFRDRPSATMTLLPMSLSAPQFKLKLPDTSHSLMSIGGCVQPADRGLIHTYVVKKKYTHAFGPVTL
jgi:hypothetical protein